MSTAERIAQAEYARQAMDTFVGPAFDGIRRVYMERLSAIAASEVGDKARWSIEKLALAIKVLDEVRGQVEAVARDGDLARADRRHAERIDQIPAEKKRWL